MFYMSLYKYISINIRQTNFEILRNNNFRIGMNTTVNKPDFNPNESNDYLVLLCKIALSLPCKS